LLTLTNELINFNNNDSSNTFDTMTRRLSQNFTSTPIIKNSMDNKQDTTVSKGNCYYFTCY